MELDEIKRATRLSRYTVKQEALQAVRSMFLRPVLSAPYENAFNAVRNNQVLEDISSPRS